MLALSGYIIDEEIHENNRIRDYSRYAQLNGDQKRNRRSDIWEPGEWFFFLSAFA